MKIPHNKFCVLPWISLETSPTGTIRPCCLAIEEIPNDNGELFHLSTAQFDQVQQGQYMRSLRQQFLDAKQPGTCQRCWNEEDAGRVSKRMNTLRRLKHIINDQDWSIDAKPLIFLDLKLGNICNLKCRICGSWSSSTYASEQLQFVPLNERKTNYHYQMLKRGAWPRESDIFWNELDRHKGHIRYLEFTGGEPFMIREHFELLRSFIKSGQAKDIEIHYNTNGTVFPDEALEIWPHFRHVEVAFSIDDLNERFEYQRTNAVWTQVVENLQRFQQMRSQAQNMTLQVCSTISVFNVLYVAPLAEWILTQNFDFVYWNVLHEPQCYSIKHMPEVAKAAALDSLSIGIPSVFRSDFDHIIEFMMNTPARDSDELCKMIRDLDRKRDQDFLTVAPEIAKLIGYQRE